MIERLFIHGRPLSAIAAASIVDGGYLTRTMDGASSLTVPIFDPDRRLLETGLLTRPELAAPKSSKLAKASRWQLGKVRANLDHRWFRLAGLAKQGPVLTLTFEDEIAALMRAHKRRLRFSRARHTRAQFVAWQVKEIKETRVQYVIFDLAKKQPIAEVDDTNQDGTLSTVEKKRKVRRQPGLSGRGNLKMKGLPIGPDQRKNLEISLNVADKLNASSLATTAMVCAGILEGDGFKAVPNYTGSDYGGVFQGQFKGPSHGFPLFSINDTEGQATYFLKGGRGFNGGGAISLARKDPSMKAGEIALIVEGSVSNFKSREDGINAYETYRPEAEKLIAAYGGETGIGEDRTRQVRESYTFYRGEPGGALEDAWECTGRLAEEVNWRRFTSENVFYFVSDEQLLRAKPVVVLNDDTHGLIDLDFDLDYGKPASEVTVTARADRWDSPDPGDVVEIEGFGPVDGRWIMWEDRIGLGKNDLEVTLRRPAPEKPEPSPKTRQVSGVPGDTATATGGDDLRSRIVKVASDSMTSKTGFSRYSQPGALTTNVTPPAPARSDCSQWVRAVYLKAGAEDPGTNTWQQAAKGRRVGKPKPGDLMFPPSVGHVEIYIGGDPKRNTIGHGSPPIDYGSTSSFPGAFFVTFDFLDK